MNQSKQGCALLGATLLGILACGLGFLWWLGGADLAVSAIEAVRDFVVSLYASPPPEAATLIGSPAGEGWNIPFYQEGDEWILLAIFSVGIWISIPVARRWWRWAAPSRQGQALPFRRDFGLFWLDWSLKLEVSGPILVLRWLWRASASPFVWILGLGWVPGKDEGIARHTRGVGRKQGAAAMLSLVIFVLLILGGSYYLLR